MLHLLEKGPKKGLGNGYDWKKGKSNNAVYAEEEEGKLPRSKFAKELGVSSSVISNTLVPCEWHHTSKCFNKTAYYDPYGLTRKEMAKLISILPKKGKGRKFLSSIVLEELKKRLNTEKRKLGHFERSKRYRERVRELKDILKKRGYKNISLSNGLVTIGKAINKCERSDIPHIYINVSEDLQDLSLKTLLCEIKKKRKEKKEHKKELNKNLKKVKNKKEKWLKEGITKKELDKCRENDNGVNGFIHRISPGDKVYGNWADRLAWILIRTGEL